MKSMTGYAEKQFEISGYSMQCELKTVNGRFLTTTISLPESLTYLERKLLPMVKDKILRGAFYLKLTLTQDQNIEKLSYNYELLTEDLNTIRNFTSLVSLQEPTLSDILNVLNPFKKTKIDIFTENDKKEILNKMNDTILELDLYREEEGVLLRKDLIERNYNILSLTKKLEEELKLSETKIKKNLENKISSLKIEIDESRFAQEVIYYLNKYDFSEELTRLSAHIDIFKTTIENENIGRKLDFILQEMNREVNTIGSKSKSNKISEIVILLKTEIEKIKEQVQNVE